MTKQTKNDICVILLSIWTAFMLSMMLGMSARLMMKASQKPHAVEGREYWINLRDGTNWQELDDSFDEHRLLD